MIKGTRKAKRPWGPEEDKLLREMVEAGKSVTLMALRHRRTEEAIRQRLHVLDIHLRDDRKNPPA
jgi:hypothetical protein